MNDPQILVVVVALFGIGSAILSLVPGVEQQLGITRERAFYGTACIFLASLVLAFAAQTVQTKRDKRLVNTATTVAPLAPFVTVEEETKSVIKDEPLKENTPIEQEAKVSRRYSILYGTTTGTSKELAECLVADIKAASVAESLLVASCEAINIAEYDDDALTSEDIAIFVVSTHSEGAPPLSCNDFFKFVEEATTDFRYGADALKKISYAVFGVGNADYAKNHYCTAAKRLDKWLAKLGAVRLLPVGLGNDSEDLYDAIRQWSRPLINQPLTNISEAGVTKKFLTTKKVEAGSVSLIDPKSSKPAQKDEEVHSCGGSDDDDDDEGYDDESQNDEDRLNDALVNADEPILDDVEDLQVVATTSSKQGTPSEMVTPLQRKNLTKQGYKLIGSHSAVKLCRWTKAQVRGRGGCYKHTFYGINSHQCMEATPSLACANKCVFCWRTHTNPVGREWRWKTDAPDFIVQSAVSEHLQMMKSLRGIQGAIPERVKEAQTIRHCALSLVGEPIMYPRINDLLRELHDRHISSFLVTNAQFPEAIRNLNPITQLYVSVDASTKDALKAIDRPLFGDFWERFQDSLAALREVKGRTVFRLTLVNDRNVGKEEDMDGYAKLVVSSKPDLIEIKGVTFCGKSNASDLTMKDVPWHHEVRSFSQQLCERVLALSTDDEYGLACEHAHSVCVLLARKDKYFVNGDWHTWIDFDKFQELERRWRATGEGFDAKDYRLKTPSWALFGASEEGFDPAEKRFSKVRNTAVKKAAAALAAATDASPTEAAGITAAGVTDAAKSNEQLQTVNSSFADDIDLD